MARQILNRLAALPILMLIVALWVFTLAYLSPYEPAEAYVEAYGLGMMTAEEREAYIRAWGLDRSFPEQFAAWFGNLLRGDLGKSRLLAGTPVAQAIAQRLGPSLLLVATGLALALAWGLVAGVVAAACRDSPLDWAVRAVAYWPAFAPVYWLALLAVFVFAVALNWLPVGGASDLRSIGGPVVHWRHLILPAGVLALSQQGWFTMYVRNAVLEGLQEDPVRLARAYGLGRWAVIWRHVLPGALLPAVTLMGTHLPELIGGSVLVESVFGWPGLGDLTIRAARAADLPLLLAITLAGGVLVVLGNLLADLLYQLLDPRVRNAVEGGRSA